MCVPFLTTEQLTADEAEGTATPSPKHHPQLTHSRQKKICPGVIHCRVADGWGRHFATVGPAKKESGETKFPTRPLIVARTNLRSFQKTFGAYCIQPGSCPPRKRQDGLRGHINQTLLFPTTNKAIQHSAPKVFLKNTPPPPSTILWAGFLIVWRTPRPYGAESVLEVLQGSVAESGKTKFPTRGARPLIVAPSDIIFLTGFGDVRGWCLTPGGSLRGPPCGGVSRVPMRGVRCGVLPPQALYVGSDAGCCSSPEPLGQARGTQAEPKRNPRRVLVRRCFRVEEPKGGNRNPGRNPARLLVRLGLRGRAPLRGIYYYYRGGRAPQGATRRCAPALYRGPGPKRVASQSCQVVFRTCL